MAKGTNIPDNIRMNAEERKTYEIEHDGFDKKREVDITIFESFLD